MAALGPSVDFGASAQRGNAQFPLPLAAIGSASLSASWEADLFDGKKLALQAAQARFEGAQAQWHDARTVIAAETALLYLSVQYCGNLLGLLQEDAEAIKTIERNASLAVGAGLLVRSSLELTRVQASMADLRIERQRAACDTDIKSMAALTAIAETQLRSMLAAGTLRRFEAPPVFAVDALPARVILQRPDVVIAEREMMAAASDIGQIQASRLPRLSLSGSIGMLSVRGQGLSTDLDTWAIGPLRLQLPIHDGGIINAREAAARARYEDSVKQVQAKVRHAVREVEDALQQAHSLRQRMRQAEAARAHLESTHQAITMRHRAGLATRNELEESRRALIDNEITLLGLKREQWIAGVTLYRAAGGGWASTVTQS